MSEFVGNIEIRNDNQNKLDEVVLSPYVHLERLSDWTVWIGVYTGGKDDPYVHLFCGPLHGRLVVMWENAGATHETLDEDSDIVIDRITVCQSKQINSFTEETITEEVFLSDKDGNSVFHLERMTDHQFWFVVYDGKKSVHVHLGLGEDGVSMSWDEGIENEESPETNS